MSLRKFKIVVTSTLVLILTAAAASCSASRADLTPTGDDLQIGDFSVNLEKTEADDIAQILGINRWKFTLQRDSEQEVGLEATLSITSPDTPEEGIDEMRIFTTESELDGMVAIYPLGESLFNANEIRIYLQLGSGSTSSVMPNPFKDFSSAYSANPADVLEEGNLRLMAFSDTGPMPSPENTALSLGIEQFESETRSVD